MDNRFPETVQECYRESDFKLKCRRKNHDGVWKADLYFDINGRKLHAEFDISVEGTLSPHDNNTINWQKNDLFGDYWEKKTGKKAKL